MRLDANVEPARVIPPMKKRTSATIAEARVGVGCIDRGRRRMVRLCELGETSLQFRFRNERRRWKALGEEDKGKYVFWEAMFDGAMARLCIISYFNNNLSKRSLHVVSEALGLSLRALTVYKVFRQMRGKNHPS